MTTTKTIPAGITKSTPVMLDAEKFIFKGNSKNLEKYKAQILAYQNEIGSIRTYTYGTYYIRFKKLPFEEKLWEGDDYIILVVPKSWVIIL